MSSGCDLAAGGGEGCIRPPAGRHELGCRRSLPSNARADQALRTNRELAAAALSPDAQKKQYVLAHELRMRQVPPRAESPPTAPTSAVTSSPPTTPVTRV